MDGYVRCPDDIPLALLCHGNDGAGHAEPDAEGTESESDADVEKQFEESTGKKREYHPFRRYTEIKRWKTGAASELEDEEINHEILHAHEEIYAAEPLDEGSWTQAA